MWGLSETYYYIIFSYWNKIWPVDCGPPEMGGAETTERKVVTEKEQFRFFVMNFFICLPKSKPKKKLKVTKRKWY